MAELKLKWLARALAEAERGTAAGAGAVAHGGSSAAHGGSSTARGGAAVALAAGPLANPRAEDWRYANLRSLEAVESFATVAPEPPADGTDAAARSRWPARMPGVSRLCFIDGRLSPADSDATHWPTPMQPPPATAPFAQVAELFDAGSLRLQLSGPVQLELLHYATGTTPSYGRLQLELAAGAQVRLTEWHLGGSPTRATLHSPTLHLSLQPGAALEHDCVQQMADGARWFATQVATLHAGSEYRLRQILLGAQTARTSLDVTLAGAGSVFDSATLSVAQQARVHDLSAKVTHAAPDSRTTQWFRGLASGQGHSSASAEVLVQPEGAGADVSQSLRGLLADKGSEINLRPRLTILTDQVKAVHGATTGQLDEQALFYLLSRGLQPEAARALLKWAFLDEVLARITVPGLRQRVAQAVATTVGMDRPPEWQP